MPVWKFKTVEEMAGSAWLERGDPLLARAIEAVWDFGRRTTQPRYPPGVYRHRSLSEAQRRAEEWDAANFAAFRARRRSEGKK